MESKDKLRELALEIANAKGVLQVELYRGKEYSEIQKDYQNSIKEFDKYLFDITIPQMNSWIIEVDYNDIKYYWTGLLNKTKKIDFPEWSNDIHKSIRFSRKIDAENIISELLFFDKEQAHAVCFAF